MGEINRGNKDLLCCPIWQRDGLPHKPDDVVRERLHLFGGQSNANTKLQIASSPGTLRQQIPNDRIVFPPDGLPGELENLLPDQL